MSHTDGKWRNGKLIGPAVSVPVNMGRQTWQQAQVYNPGTSARQGGEGEESAQVTVQGSAEPVGLA